MGMVILSAPRELRSQPLIKEQANHKTWFSYACPFLAQAGPKGPATCTLVLIDQVLQYKYCALEAVV